MATIPQIRIQFSHLLYRSECIILDNVRNNGVGQIASVEKYEKKAKQYRIAWKKYEEAILNGIVDALGVDYYRNIIDVALAPYFGNKSFPLIINFLSEPDVFIDKLTHELLHVIQTDNTVYQVFNKNKGHDLITEWQRLFGEHDRKTLVHIPLQALHKHIYLDILQQPERMERELQELRRSPTGKSYLDAWQYIESNDYLDIIEQLRKMYAAWR